MDSRNWSAIVDRIRNNLGTPRASYRRRDQTAGDDTRRGASLRRSRPDSIPGSSPHIESKVARLLFSIGSTTHPYQVTSPTLGYGGDKGSRKKEKKEKEKEHVAPGQTPRDRKDRDRPTKQSLRNLMIRTPYEEDCR